MPKVRDSSVHVRVKRKTYENGTYDTYYAQRYASTVGLDARLSALICHVGADDFLRGKKVLDIGCGIGLICFQIAALFGASHVVGIDSDLETILTNLKQLRKLKHDGIVFASEDKKNSKNEFPSILVRRNGPARCTNKPWLVRPYSLDCSSGFPFNVEFRHADRPEATDTFEIVFCLKVRPSYSAASIQSCLAPGGYLVTDDYALQLENAKRVVIAPRLYLFQRKGHST